MINLNIYIHSEEAILFLESLISSLKDLYRILIAVLYLIAKVLETIQISTYMRDG